MAIPGYEVKKKRMYRWMKYSFLICAALLSIKGLKDFGSWVYLYHYIGYIAYVIGGGCMGSFFGAFLALIRNRFPD